MNSDKILQKNNTEMFDAAVALAKCNGENYIEGSRIDTSIMKVPTKFQTQEI